MTRDQLRSKITDSILMVLTELEEIQDILQKENLPNQEVYILESEHAALMLKCWYLPVPNTSIESFTLTGDVD